MRYEEMSDEQVKKAVDECLRRVVGERMHKRAEEGGVRTEEIRLMLRRRLGMTENDVALFITPTPVFDRLPEGEFKIRIVALAPSGEILQWEILSNEIALI